MLLKNKDNLTLSEKEKLEEVKKKFPILKKMHSQKEQFRKIYETSQNWQEGLLKISNWLKKGTKLFPESSKTIRNLWSKNFRVTANTPKKSEKSEIKRKIHNSRVTTTRT